MSAGNCIYHWTLSDGVCPCTGDHDMEYMQSQVIQVFSASYGENLNDAISLAANAVIWFVYFTVVYWLAGCVREIFVLKKSYLRERSLCVKFYCGWRMEGTAWQRKSKTCSWMLENIQSILPPSIWALLHIDFRDNTNKTILRIVLLNFAVIFVISMFWMYGIWVLIIYSVGFVYFPEKVPQQGAGTVPGYFKIDQSAGGRESGFPDYRRCGNFRAGSEWTETHSDGI